MTDDQAKTPRPEGPFPERIPGDDPIEEPEDGEETPEEDAPED